MFNIKFKLTNSCICFTNSIKRIKLYLTKEFKKKKFDLIYYNNFYLNLNKTNEVIISNFVFISLLDDYKSIFTIITNIVLIK